MRLPLEQRYALVPREIVAGGRAWSLLHLPDADDLLDELIAKGPDHPDMVDEKFPYWAEIWPSSLALAAAVQAEPEAWRGRSAIELGCGPGLAGLAATAHGADVLFTDWLEEALELTRLNARRNLHRDVAVMPMDWRRPLSDRRFDRILAADCTYEARFFDDVIRCLDALLAPDGEVWLAEPGRSVARDFFQRLRVSGWNPVPLPAEPAAPVVWKIRRVS